jgi:hypothetical protein
MKRNRLAMGLGVIFMLALLAMGVIVWLANAPLMPPVQTVQQSIPDDRIPH